MADGRSAPAGHGLSQTGASDDQDAQSGATRHDDKPAGCAKESNEQSDRLPLNGGKCGKPEDTASFAPDPGSSDTGCPAQLTKVAFVYHRRPYAMWLRFGKPHITCSPAPGHLVECYAPGQVFGLARSVSHGDGDARSSFDVLEGAWPGQSVSPMPDVDPGAHVLLSAKGWRTVSRIFALIDAIEALGIDPCSLAPAFWTEVQSRLPGNRARRSHPNDTVPTSLHDTGTRP